MSDVIRKENYKMKKDTKTIYYKLEENTEKFNTIPIKVLEDDLKNEREFSASVMRDIFNYGEKLLFRMMEECTGRICRDAIIIMIQRDILEFIDAIAILIDNTAHSSAKVFLRNIFERMLIVTYILKPTEFKIQEKRACEYMLLNLYERKKFLEELNDCAQLKEVNSLIKETLNYKDDSVENYKLYEGDNYNISISKLANKVKCKSLYRKYYSPISNHSHGKNILDHVSLNENVSLVSELHCPFNSIQFLNECSEIILKIYDLFENRLFENYGEYKKWEKVIKNKMNKEKSILMFHEKEMKKMEKISKSEYMCITNI